MHTLFSFILVLSVASAVLMLITEVFAPRPYSRELHEDDEQLESEQ